MSDIDVDRSASPTLRSRSAGQAVMQMCLAVQGGAPRRGRLARALGHSPLHPDAVAWYDHALAELETGRRLASLSAGYTVLHSLPVGEAEGASRADVEHLVIGPAGLFCLNSTTSVTPARLEEVSLEARQVSKHLSRTLQRVVTVTPMLVTVGSGDAKAIGVKATAGKALGIRRAVEVEVEGEVEVVAARALAGWFAKRGPVLTTAELANLALAAEQPGTWHVPAEVLEREVVVDGFHQLRSEVDAASDRQQATITAAVTTAVLLMVVSAAIIVSSLSGLLQLAGF
jgi:hypothetical protein